MSYYGKKWLIGGLPTGLIMRSTPGNGRYTVVFEREFASLEEIEAVNWAQPAIEYIGTGNAPPGLPEGYGFEVADIQYQNNTRSYHVILKTASQYLGDVTGYQDQIAELESEAAEKDSTISSQASQLQEQAAALSQQTATLQEQASTIADQAATIAELESSGGGAAITSQLEEAYTEGVESNG